MFKYIFEQIENVAIWPIISLAIFFLFFIGLLVYVMKMDKGWVKKMKNLPLDEKEGKQGFGESVAKFKKYALTLVLMSVATFSGAQSANSSTGFDQETTMLIVLSFVLLICLVVLGVAVAVYGVFKVVVDGERLKKMTALAEEKGVAIEELLGHEESWWKKFWWKNVNDSVTIEDEGSIMLDHDYDGIKELDNHLPPWWKYSFYGSIVFAIVYLLIYHVFNTAPLQAEEYQAEMKLAAVEAAARNTGEESNVDENTVVFTDDATILKSAKSSFERTCAACHSEHGGGNSTSVGPNLTDEYWIHGGSINDVFKTIKYGVPSKGMVAWEKVLSPAQISGLSSYIMTLQGSNPPGAKAPQGDKYSPDEGAQSTESDSVVVDQVEEATTTE